MQTRSVRTIMPTDAMRSGDFLRSRMPPEQPVTIYDPITGQPFPGNRIPANRISPVAAGDAAVPADGRHADRDNGSANYTRTSLINNKFSQMYSVKLDHKITDNVSHQRLLSVQRHQ